MKKNRSKRYKKIFEASNKNKAENIDEVIIDSGATKGTSQPIIVHSKADRKPKSNKTTAA